jgi:hypothetical protein
VKALRYIELKRGHSDDGPAWIAYVTQSKSGRTVYFNGRGLMKLKGQRRGASGGNYIDVETGESFWVSGVKKAGPYSFVRNVTFSADRPEPGQLNDYGDDLSGGGHGGRTVSGGYGRGGRRR